jgi:hypothetical protein
MIKSEGNQGIMYLFSLGFLWPIEFLTPGYGLEGRRSGQKDIVQLSF